MATAVAGGWFKLSADPPERSEATEPAPPSTAPIERGALVQEVRAFGNIQFTGSRSIKNQLAGIVTWTPSANSVVDGGERLYSVDDKPVILMHGGLPAWREFAAGMTDGEDVVMLERALAALGYTDFTVDEEFTDKTQAAIKRWQKNTGLPPTGKIELGRIVFAPGALRVAQSALGPGDQAAPGAEVLQASASDQMVAADIPATAQELAVKGSSVQIELPNGKRTRGTISAVSRPKTAEDGNKVVPISVTLVSPTDVKGIQEGAVTVIVARTEAKDVHSVPVTALLPLAGGGFAVQIMDGTNIRRVTVQTGAFANGRVEISGPGITEGARVGVPKL
ncbi:peptidoglycan-binding protein [Streptomyces sp. NPDC048270]|uniref:peptidoglycan-binding protein n=1 Tax=Streptomyces sp. NPDC048270 TaxID=3154615 RepID=UPI0033FC5F52